MAPQQHRAAADPPANDRFTLRLWLGISLYLLLNAVSQGLMSGTADQDQAEQLLLAQHWALGYGAQPPLYTYLVKLLFLLSGPALWPLLGLKVALLSLLVAALLLIGRQLRFRSDQQLLALAGMALIPQFIWESQRDLTHSVLATALAACTLLQLLRLRQRPGPGRFIGLGALVGLGLLSKYSFALFAASLLLAALSLPAFRRVLLRPGLALAVATALLLLAPHLSWVLQHSALALAGLEKTESAAGPVWLGVISALKAGIAFLTPFWLAAVALLWPQRRQLQLASPVQAPDQALLQRLPLALVGVLLVFVLASGATRIKDRWYQSLLFYAPLSVATLAAPIPPRRLRWLVGTGLGAATAAALLLPGRTALAGLTGKSSRPNYPLPQLVASLVQQHGSPDLVLASNGLLGGNARLALPGIPVLTPRTPATSLSTTLRRAGTDPAAVLVLVDRGDEPRELAELLHRLQAPAAPQARPLALRLQRFSRPETWVAQRPYPIRYAWLSLPAPEQSRPNLAQ